MQARVQTEQHTELYELYVYHSQRGDSDTGLNSTFATGLSHEKQQRGPAPSGCTSSLPTIMTVHLSAPPCPQEVRH